MKLPIRYIVPNVSSADEGPWFTIMGDGKEWRYIIKQEVWGDLSFLTDTGIDMPITHSEQVRRDLKQNLEDGTWQVWETNPFDCEDRA